MNTIRKAKAKTMADWKADIRVKVEAMTHEQYTAFMNCSDSLLWLEYEFDLPSVTSDRGMALADYAEDLIDQIDEDELWEAEQPDDWMINHGY